MLLKYLEGEKQTQNCVSIIQKIKEMEFAIAKMVQQDEKNILSKLKPENTAISRKTITAPLRKALKHVDFKGKKGLDFGCGRSVDAAYLNDHGAHCFRYDPNFASIKTHYTSRQEGSQKNWQLDPNQNISSFDFVLVIYVLNVVPRDFRTLIAKTAQSLLKNPDGFIVLGVRDDFSAIQPSWEEYSDGFITSSNTFQSFFKNNKSGRRRIEALFPKMQAHSLGRGGWLLSYPQ